MKLGIRRRAIRLCSMHLFVSIKLTNDMTGNDASQIWIIFEKINVTSTKISYINYTSSWGDTKKIGKARERMKNYKKIKNASDNIPYFHAFFVRPIKRLP